MSVTPAPAPTLGVGGIVGDSFAIFFRRIVPFTVLGFVPLVVGYAAIFALAGASALEPTLGGGAAGTDVASLIAQILQIVMFSIACAFLVQAAYDAKLGRPVRYGAYLAGALRHLLPLILCSIVMWIGFAIGFMLLILPGIWLAGVWAVAVPAIVIEGAGFSALGRSASLTKGYRWPIIGAMILLGLCMMLFSIVLVMAAGAIVAAIGGVVGLVAGAILYAVVSAAGYGVFYVGIALIYARLREIKEGTGVEELTEVFA